jgi:hypothetical protein
MLKIYSLTLTRIIPRLSLLLLDTLNLSSSINAIPLDFYNNECLPPPLLKPKMLA